MNKKYITTVENLLNYLGGDENIEYFTNCITRMRFHLKDWSIVKDQEIKNEKHIVGISKNKSSEEYQVIIGIDIDSFYETFCEVNGYDLDGRTKISKTKINNKNQKNSEDFIIKQKSEISDAKNKFRRMGWFNKGLSFLGKIFAPLIYPLLGYGFILTIWALLTVEWGGAGTNTSAESIHFFDQLNSLLNVITGTFGLFITVGIFYSVFKVMGGNPIYGLVLGLILTAPSLTTMGSIANETGATGGAMLEHFPGWTLFGDFMYPWRISFTSLIIPAIGVAVFGAYMERWCSRMTSIIAKTLLNPLLIILIPFILAIFIVGPIGMLFTSYLSTGVNWLSTNSVARYIVIPLIGGLHGPLVVIGLHHSILPIVLQQQDMWGATILRGFTIVSNVTQGVSAIAFSILHKRVRKSQSVCITSGVSAIVGGITEPALFTINLKHLFPLIATSIGAFCGTLLLVTSNTFTMYGAFGVFGVLMFQHQAPVVTGLTTWAGGGYLWGMISLLSSCGIAFGMTLFLGKTKFFWNRSKKILLEDFDENVDELKLISKQEFKGILIKEKEERLKLKQNKKIK